MPNTSVQANARLCTQTILSTISGLTASRIKLGVYDQNPSQEFFEDVAVNSYFVQIEPVKWGEYSIQEQLGAFTIPVKFYFPIPSKTNFQYLNEEDVVAAMRNTLGTPGSWTALPNPSGITIADVETFLDNDAPTGLYQLSIEFSHGS